MSGWTPTQQCKVDYVLAYFPQLIFILKTRYNAILSNSNRNPRLRSLPEFKNMKSDSNPQPKQNHFYTCPLSLITVHKLYRTRTLTPTLILPFPTPMRLPIGFVLPGLWSEAVSDALRHEARWPYEWMSHALWTPKSTRGSVGGVAVASSNRDPMALQMDGFAILGDPVEHNKQGRPKLLTLTLTLTKL